MTAVSCPFCGGEHTGGTFVCPVTNRRLHGLLPVGTVVDDKYRIDAIIGVGGMGVVYRAVQSNIERTVALKMLLPEYTVYPDLVARVEREARTAGQINHANVVSIIDTGITDEHGPYIAMELLRGEELATVVESVGGRMDPAEAVDIMRQVLAGLDAAHKRGVIHRDLKPENIFLTKDEDNARGVVKVLDFGISKLRDEKELNSLTRTGTVMGTPQFMAPEQAAGARDQDVRIDLYAAGAVLYAVLCNGLPYEAENYNLLINEILNKPPIQILSRNPSLDPRLAQIVMKAIAKRPDARYQTAREMADSLGQWHANRNTPRTFSASRLQNANAAAYVSADTPAFDLRGGQGEVGYLSQFDDELSPDDPNYVERGEATVVVQIPYRGDDEPSASAGRTSSPEVSYDDDDDEPPPPPRKARRGARADSPTDLSKNPPLDEVEASPSLPELILDSPLDAPPIVLPKGPKAKPTDDMWARLRTDHPSQPPKDHMVEEVIGQARRLRLVIALFVLAAAVAIGLLIFSAVAPRTWRAWRDRVLPPPTERVVMQNSVRFVDPAPPTIVHVTAHEPPRVAPVLDAALEGDASVQDAPASEPARPRSSRGARHSRRHGAR
ncbi:MAG: serine/threonine-protein kinase [Polyangiales bacterium]